MVQPDAGIPFHVMGWHGVREAERLAGLRDWRDVAEGDNRARVIAFVAVNRDTQAEFITPASRLFHDLGLDGGEAGAFFRAFGARFDVDLAPLYGHWDQHFGGEAILTPWLLMFPATGAWAWSLVRGGQSPVWALLALGCGVGVWALWWGDRRASRPFIHITVVDLIDAAAQGVWSVDYPAPSELLTGDHAGP